MSNKIDPLIGKYSILVQQESQRIKQEYPVLWANYKKNNTKKPKQILT